MTTSSGLGPEKGLAVVGIVVAVYESVKRLFDWFARCSLELNMVLAKADGSAGSNSDGLDIAFSLFSSTFPAVDGALSVFSCA